jgi:predicted peptidase
MLALSPMRQQPCTYLGRSKRARPLRYLLHLPAAGRAAPGTGWPLLLFLHGAGERGDDLELLLQHGIPRLIEEGTELPFVAASPQCPAGTFWYKRLTGLRSLVDELVATRSIDAGRLYLTGLSMGGYGCWHLAARHPELFAAMVPICGGGLSSHGFPARARALRELPIWAFHGRQDNVVPPEETTRLVDELRACDGKVRLTLYEGVGHDSWTRTYADPELYRWLLAQRRPPPAVQAR